jgi:hypothetical protein
MKRTVVVAFASISLIFGAASCQKAHEAGNDSMSAPAGGKPSTSDVGASGARQ